MGSVTLGLGITSAGWTREATGGHGLGRPREATGGHGFGNFGAGDYLGRLGSGDNFRAGEHFPKALNPGKNPKY